MNLFVGIGVRRSARPKFIRIDLAGPRSAITCQTWQSALDNAWDLDKLELEQEAGKKILGPDLDLSFVANENLNVVESRLNIEMRNFVLQQFQYRLGRERFFPRPIARLPHSRFQMR